MRLSLKRFNSAWLSTCQRPFIINLNNVSGKRKLEKRCGHPKKLLHEQPVRLKPATAEQN
jgi:hypothetical protein